MALYLHSCKYESWSANLCKGSSSMVMVAGWVKAEVVIRFVARGAWAVLVPGRSPRLVFIDFAGSRAGGAGCDGFSYSYSLVPRSTNPTTARFACGWTGFACGWTMKFKFERYIHSLFNLVFAYGVPPIIKFEGPEIPVIWV